MVCPGSPHSRSNTKPRFPSRSSFGFCVQTWLNESPAQLQSGKQPAFFSLITSGELRISTLAYTPTQLTFLLVVMAITVVSQWRYIKQARRMLRFIQSSRTFRCSFRVVHQPLQQRYRCQMLHKPSTDFKIRTVRIPNQIMAEMVGYLYRRRLW